ncbi:GNAT family N-acetyltransferase [Planktothrix paucivesiculata]|uniref:GCN5-related N-acetyltransferase n=1 Tax=Planktothrix paucivesiculata PCC 9631 TaxID=671071 RepID=A0A7Z9BVU1_9CYAN|nr:GNAT family N-acetyltransferase [Planktothrix paucivesiculata]VXD22393.1 GCN5-related N-acetyltransferase [Planktothrix paucivesiculata PCC 9631]
MGYGNGTGSNNLSGQENPLPTESSVDFSSLQVRPATSADLTGLTDVLAESFHSREGLFGWIYPILRLGIYEDSRYRLLANPDQYLCLVAVISGVRSAKPSILGTIEIGLRSRYPWQLSLTSRYLYISNLAVHPQYRQMGIAQKLLASCEQTAHCWGFSNLYLHVLENNHQARGLYYKMGYRLIEIDSGWDSALLGQPRRLFLQKKIVINP